MTNRRFPVLGTDLTIPWEVAELANRELAKRTMGAVTPMARRLGQCWLPIKERYQRGGFTESELDAWAPGWREVAR